MGTYQLPSVPFLTISEAMNLLGGYSSSRAFLRMCRKQRLKVTKLTPRTLRIDRRDLEVWLQRRVR